nr:LytR C-terminal domain-containing protein [Corynebacterium lujinxingii]
MTQKGGDDNAADNAASTETSTSTEVVAPSPAQADGQQQEGQAGASQDPNAPASETAPRDPNAPASETAPRDPNAQDDNARDGDAQAPAPAAPAPQGAQLNSGNAEVFVYNNSGVADLASRTADQLQGQFRVANQSPDAAAMNMPEQQYGVFPETYVFFDPATPGAEQVAADIARRVGGTARAKNDIPEGAVSLPEQAANNRSAVAVVLAG